MLVLLCTLWQAHQADLLKKKKKNDILTTPLFLPRHLQCFRGFPESILSTLSDIMLGHEITFHHFQGIQGLMATLSTVIPLGLLHVRPFQLWLRAKGFHLKANPQRQIRVRAHAKCFVPFLKSMFMVSACPEHFVHFLKSMFMVRACAECFMPFLYECNHGSLSMRVFPLFMTVDTSLTPMT